MKKLLLILPLLLTACGSYDLPVAVLDNSQDYRNSDETMSTSTTKRTVVQEKVKRDADYERTNSQNQREYLMQKQMQCSLGIGYDKNGELCDKNVYYESYQKATSISDSCCQCNDCDTCTSSCE